jgi:hypothetical protein
VTQTAAAREFGDYALVIATGAGWELRRSLDIAVLSGMIGVTQFGNFLTPVFYLVINRSNKAAPSESAKPVPETGNHQPRVETEPEVA